MSYSVLLSCHIAIITISGAFFALRGFWMLTGNPLLELKLVRVLPHIVDTLLLVTGLTLAFQINAFWQGWLVAKLSLLVLYIGLGVVALRRGKTQGIRAGAFAAALAVYAGIVSLALTH